MEQYDIHITLTEEEFLSAKYVMADCQIWTENAIRERARIAGDEIVQLYVSNAIQNGWSIPSSKLEIIKDAYAKGVVKQPSMSSTIQTELSYE